MAHPMRDVVVVIPGITGSTLVRRIGQETVPIWVPSFGGLVQMIKTLGRNIGDLEIGDPLADDGIEAVGFMPDLHLIPGILTVNLGYSALVRWLTTTFDLIPSGPAWWRIWSASPMTGASRTRSTQPG